MVDLLGHKQLLCLPTFLLRCKANVILGLDLLLRHRHRTRLLWLGVCMAVALRRGRQPVDPVRPAFKTGAGFRCSDCVERGEYGFVPLCVLFHEVEE